MKKRNKYSLLIIILILFGLTTNSYAYFKTNSFNTVNTNYELEENNTDNIKLEDNNSNNENNNENETATLELNNNLKTITEVNETNNLTKIEIDNNDESSTDNKNLIKQTKNIKPVTTGSQLDVKNDKITNNKKEETTTVLESQNKKDTFTGTFDTNKISEQLNEFLTQHKENKNNRSDKQKKINVNTEIAKKIKENQETEAATVAKFEKVYEGLTNKELGAAIEEAELNKCRTYYSNSLKAKIAKNFNLLNLYADRSDKVMIAYNLWKQNQPVPPIVDTAINKIHNRILEYKNDGLWRLSSLQYWNDIEFKRIHTCKKVKLKYLELTRRTSELGASTSDVLYEMTTIKSMKRLIHEFTDATPFDKEFLFYLGCSFDKKYIDNLTPATWPKDENGDSIPIDNCETTANPFLYW